MESTRNYAVMEDGIRTKGYSRYGAWYGDPYGDWCAMFVSFCLDYALAEDFPLESNCPNWILKLREQGLYREAEGYIPEPSDVIFFDWDGDKISDHVGLVAEYIPATEDSVARIRTIEGNSADCVQYVTYKLADPDILGYGVVSWLDGGELSYTGEDFAVTVSFGPEANIPANAVLTVRELEPDSPEYETHYTQSNEAINAAQSDEEAREISFARFFDISFLVNSSVIEPEAPVSVCIFYEQPLIISSEDAGVAVHFADDGIELLDVETYVPDSGDDNFTEGFSFTQEGFSVTGTVVTTRSSVALLSEPDYSGASNLSDCITSIQVLGSNGTETTFFADGDSYTLVIEGTVYNYLYQSGGDKALKFTLPSALPMSEFVCSNTASHAKLDDSSNTFYVNFPAVMENGSYQNVPFRIELKGQAVNKTGAVVNAQIRWTNYLIYPAKYIFTHTSEDGTVAVLELMGGTFTPENFDLFVETVDASAYSATISNYLSNNFNRRELLDAEMYYVYLQSKTDVSQRYSIPAPYNLTLTYATNPVEMVSQGQATVVNMNNGNANKPSGSSVITDASGVTKAGISDQYSSLSHFALVSTGGISPGTTGSGYSLSYNEQKDAFITDPAYDIYYNENSPIGTAGSFHIVAFGTANLDTHTNGNVLANNLYANSNFGTNNYGYELSYIQNYRKVNSNSASMNDHILVVGSENEIGFYDNNNKYTINGQGLDRPKNLIQDRDTGSAPFIDLNRVESEIRQIGANLAGYSDRNLMITYQSQKNIITLTNPNSVGIINVTPSDDSIFGKDYIQLSGFSSGYEGSIVINVDCSGYTEIDLPKALIVVDGQEQGTNEVTEFSNGKVLWNFLNAEGVTINTHLMTGIVIAPGATVNVMQNLNGTVVAENVNIKAESHRTDFTGKIIPNSSDSEHSVIIRKIRSGNAGISLSGAHFHLFVWDGTAWVRTGSDGIVTDADGLFTLEELRPNTAYKLVEVEAPTGYALSEEPYYFWLSVNGNGDLPTVMPQGFTGTSVSAGGVLTVANEPDASVETTSIQLLKSWNTLQEITTPRVYLQLYQLVWNEGYLIDRVLYKTVTITKALGWSYTVTELPLNGTDESGKTVTYTYAVEELPVEGYTPQYSMDPNTGVSEGTITVTNTPEGEEGFVLPATGGYGTFSVTFGGCFLMVFAIACLSVLWFRRRREDGS